MRLRFGIVGQGGTKSHRDLHQNQVRLSAIKRGEVDANKVLSKYIKTKEGETLDGE